MPLATMRTVDPVLWSRKVVKPPIDVVRPWRYRVQATTAFERRMRLSLGDAMLELLRNCSMEGVRFVMDERNQRPVRWCYCVLVLSSVAGCVAVGALNLATLRSRPPVAVVLQAAALPVHQVDFPAVAICSYNTISATQLDTYARYLYSLQIKPRYSFSALRKNLMAFAGLITLSSHVSFDINFTQFLAEVARETNVTNIIHKLSPKCESMLVRCGWRGRRARCDTLFALRMTDVGYCCVFNARYSSEDRNNPPFRVNRAGQDYGLSVVVRENPDDFTVVRRSGEELELFIFDGREYPLRRAGVIRSFPVQRNGSVFIALQATVQHASSSLRYYTEAWRGCVLTHPEGLPSHSWSQCVAECRRKATLAICDCSPHTKPVSDRDGDEVPCSLNHLACLAKHKEKLSTFNPGEHAHESLSEEQADSVECLHCRPNCARLRYTARVWSVPYKFLTKRSFYNNFIEGVKLWNSTVLRVFFMTQNQDLYVVESNMRIYEIISFFSSQWVLVVGATVVTLWEVVYHCTLRWRHHNTRRRRRDALPRVHGPSEKLNHLNKNK